MLWIILVLVVVGLFYWAFVKPMKYWTGKNVTQGPVVPLLGDLHCTFFRTNSFTGMMKEIYKRFPNERYTGLYQMTLPTLMITDLELIKQLTVKDFDHFTNHKTIIPEDLDILWGKNLFVLKDQKWRDMRALLSPAFTSSKMRLMFSLINECGEQFTKYYLEQGSTEAIVLEMKDTFSRYANDVIATCAFGIKVDSLKERHNEFYNMGKELSDFSGFKKIIKVFFYIVFPKLTKILNIRWFSKKLCHFFQSLISDTLRTREEQNIIRPDMINLLMEARKGRLKYDEEDDIKDSGFATTEESHIGKAITNQKEEITDIDITAQAMIFFFAGFDTVSTHMSFLAYELACNPDIQERLIKEVDETRLECGGQLTYEKLAQMKYMDMVLSEALRKWPSVIAVDRLCVKPYTIEPKNPGESPVEIKVGDLIWVPIIGIHYDEKYFSDAERFNPERFSDVNKDKIAPYTYMPFGSGPRNCIGSRFALMETKTIFFHLLSKFEFTVIKKTTIPMRISKASFSLTAEDGIWLGLKPRII